MRSRAIEIIAAAYWKPIYKYARMKWRMEPEDAADFTQDFFACLLEKGFLDSYDSRKGRLRKQLAETLLSAHQSGKVKAVIGRAPDFYGPGVRMAAVGEKFFAALLAK